MQPIPGNRAEAALGECSSQGELNARLCRIVLAQLEGSGRGSLASYNVESYDALTAMLHEEPMRDGDAWVEKLFESNKMLGTLHLHTLLRTPECHPDVFQAQECLHLSL